MKSEEDGDGEVAWGAPQRFGGPFHATVAKGDERLAMQLPLNHSLAMASSAATSFFLTVLVGGDGESLPEKQIPLQVRCWNPQCIHPVCSFAASLACTGGLVYFVLCVYLGFLLHPVLCTFPPLRGKFCSSHRYESCVRT